MKKDNKIRITIGGISVFWIILVLSIVVGINMTIIGSTSHNIRKVEVLEEDNDVIKIKWGEINGDPIIREMKKPLFSNYKKGDKILVKEDNNKISRSMDPDKVNKIGEILINVPILVLISIEIIVFGLILVSFLIGIIWKEKR